LSTKRILPITYPYVPDKESHLPRKEYKTITVKSESFQKFIKAIKEAKKGDPSLDNSTFLNLLVSRYKKTLVMERRPNFR
jgi:phosphopantothenoylcysteine synthetase/decarboxylase